MKLTTLARKTAHEFQSFISAQVRYWEHDFSVDRGKMFGLLVVQKQNETLGYLGTVSAKLRGDSHCEAFVPSVFDNSADDCFINKVMRRLAELNLEIDASTDTQEVNLLKSQRKETSIALQQQLFENYHFTNLSGNVKNVLQIFDEANLGYPSSAAGECAAPKLLQYALEHQLKPIALAEFWWGLSDKSKLREHGEFYPACKKKCRPILEFMLEDEGLYEDVNKNHKD